MERAAGREGACFVATREASHERTAPPPPPQPPPQSNIFRLSYRAFISAWQPEGRNLPYVTLISAALEECREVFFFFFPPWGIKKKKKKRNNMREGPRDLWRCLEFIAFGMVKYRPVKQLRERGGAGLCPVVVLKGVCEIWWHLLVSMRCYSPTRHSRSDRPGDPQLAVSTGTDL